MRFQINILPGSARTGIKTGSRSITGCLRLLSLNFYPEHGIINIDQNEKVLHLSPESSRHMYRPFICGVSSEQGSQIYINLIVNSFRGGTVAAALKV